MRMMLKFQVPVESGNDAVRSGEIGEILGTVLGRIRPEAAYFGAEDGERAAYVFFDLTDPSQLPVIAEPLFQRLNARVHFAPVMNVDDLQKGVGESSQS